MKTILKISALLLAVIAAMPLTGQSLRAYEQKALEAHRKRDYSAALAYEKILLEVDSQRVDALFRGGEAARHLRAFDQAEMMLGKIPDSLKTGLHATTDFSLAMAQKGLGKYAEAAESFRRFIDSRPPDLELLVARANDELEHCLWAMEERQGASGIQVTHLDDNVNTTSSDFAPFRFADRLYFSSAYEFDTAQTAVMRIFSAIGNAPSQLSDLNTSDNDKHSSHLSLTVDAKRMYFTTCDNGEFPNTYNCEIYYRDKSYEGTWGPAIKLPRHINADSCTTTQPSIGLLRKHNGYGIPSEQKEVLFFASNRKGGKGGMDIWASEIQRSPVGEFIAFGEPYPLPFNTPQNDITPFYHTLSQTLYFSSDGREGMGGLDVFFTKKNKDGSWAEPVNLGYPLNSSSDDLYYTFHSGSRQAYFASNRPGTLCADPTKTCTCNDIYSADFSVSLDVWTWNDVDSSSLSGVLVELFDLTLDKVDSFYVNPTGNKFSFPLELEREYRITGTLKHFSTAYAAVDTRGLNQQQNFERNLYLRPGVELIVRTFNAIDSSALYGATVSLSGDMERQHVNDAYSNTCSFRLEYGKNYSILGTKPEFTSARAQASTTGMNQPDTLYRDLYLSPFLGLPLVLYFDNDKPRYIASYTDDDTPLTYEQAYSAFIGRKGTFFEGYLAGRTGQNRDDAQRHIESFFRDTVEANYAKLEKFCGLLEGFLAAGNDLEILIAGYASPLADSIYNRHLTSRRISSLENHFAKFNKGALAPFIESGHLRIIEDPKGEVNPDQNVSDDQGDPQSSVFSPAASKLRRVTITDIRAMPSGGGLNMK